MSADDSEQPKSFDTSLPQATIAILETAGLGVIPEYHFSLERVGDDVVRGLRYDYGIEPPVSP